MRRFLLSASLIILGLSGLTLFSNAAPSKPGAKPSKAASSQAKTSAPFRAIKRNMTRRQVQALVGKPTSTTGSGLYIEVYPLSDKSSVWLGWTGPTETAQLVYVKHRTKSGDKELLPNP
jgi:hypothetical protein